MGGGEKYNINGVIRSNKNGNGKFWDKFVGERG